MILTSCQTNDDRTSKNSIPYPLEEWKGVQGKTLADSKLDFVGQKKADKDAPNVIFIMLDDAGYSSSTSFGGVMKTPNFDRIGDEGIRYSHMSVAAVCSPTRGSLLTGYNIHQIGTGIISEFASGYPGYNSQMDYSTPSIARILTDNGCTAEGTPTGTFSELLMQNGFPPLTMEQQLEKLEKYGGIEEWGGPNLANHYSVAWANASSTPFQWTKQMASHFGGTMSATAIRYPKMINAI